MASLTRSPSSSARALSTAQVRKPAATRFGTYFLPILVGALLTCLAIAAQAQTSNQGASSQELAKQLNNPVASLISVPFQFKYDHSLGYDNDGFRRELDIQPVFPFSIGENWNLISRTIIPYIYMKDVTGPGNEESGFGDVVQSFFFSPKAPTSGGWIWGAGPVILAPWGADEFSGDQWGLGPTFVALRQQNGWTYGGLANHIWGINPDDGDDAIKATFLQPFISYTTANSWTFSINAEASYDWNSEEWSVPLQPSVSKMFHVGKQPISFQVGARYWADAPDTGPEGTSVRATLTFLFPK